MGGLLSYARTDRCGQCLYLSMTVLLCDGHCYGSGMLLFKAPRALALSKPMMSATSRLLYADTIRQQAALAPAESSVAHRRQEIPLHRTECAT